MPSSRQELLLAYRWPIALVGSSLILGELFWCWRKRRCDCLANRFRSRSKVV